jgi:hypothetical protein
MELLINHRKLLIIFTRSISLFILVLLNKANCFSGFRQIFDASWSFEFFIKLLLDLCILKICSFAPMTDKRKIIVFNNPALLYSLYFNELNTSILFFVVFLIYYLIATNKLIYSHLVIAFLFFIKGVIFSPFFALNTVFVKKYLTNYTEKLFFYCSILIFLFAIYFFDIYSFSDIFYQSLSRDIKFLESNYLLDIYISAVFLVFFINYKINLELYFITLTIFALISIFIFGSQDIYPILSSLLIVLSLKPGNKNYIFSMLSPIMKLMP